MAHDTRASWFGGVDFGGWDRIELGRGSGGLEDFFGDGLRDFL